MFLSRVFALICTFVLFGSTAFAQAKDFSGFVQIRPGVSLYTELKIQDPSKPTLVLVNGLTYHTKYWTLFSTMLKPYGYNILRFDPRGMGQTLLRDGFPRTAFPIEEQAHDLHELTMKMGLRGPLNLLGLSYGGGLSMAFARLYPQRVKNLILVAPYTEPVANADRTIKAQIDAIRLTQPWNTATDDELYGFLLRQQVYTVNPIAEPSTLEFPLKPEGIFQLIQGIRKYDFHKAAKFFPPRSTHLVIAAMDQYIPVAMLDKFWKSVPPQARASRVLVQLSEHKVPESQPAFLAYWVDQILKGNPSAFKGNSYQANPLTNQMK